MSNIRKFDAARLTGRRPEEQIANLTGDNCKTRIPVVRTGINLPWESPWKILIFDFRSP